MPISKRNATMYDVAKIAGVSAMTVSRVTRRDSNVKVDTRKRVLQAIEELDYHPCVAARALSSNSTDNLGLIISHKSLFGDFLHEIAKGLQQGLIDKGYSLLLSTETIARGKVPLLVKQHKVDGLVIGGYGVNVNIVRNIQHQGMPIILVSNHLGGDSFNCVVSDDVEGAYHAVRHLIGLGHRRIGFVGGLWEQECAVNRLAGYVIAHMEKDLNINRRLVRQGAEIGAQGAKAIAELLELEDRPTAVFFSEDLLAIAALKAVKLKGLKVPEDMALIGFGDIGYASYTDPPLTTVTFDKVAAGRIAAEKFFRMRDNPSLMPSKTIVPTKLVVRESCGAHLKNTHQN